MNQTKVKLAINIPAECLVTKETNKFMEVHATVLPYTKMVFYDKVVMTGMTAFSFDYTKSLGLIEMIDDLCRQEAERINQEHEIDELLYHTIADYGL